MKKRDDQPERDELLGIGDQFPILKRTVHGKPLVYLDNAATTQKPVAVIETIDRYYRDFNSNVHRAVHTLSQEATTAYEGAREKIRKFINAAETREIIYTRGTTESINLVASAWGRKNLRRGDAVVISAMEHHSNIVPWQILCEQTGADLRVIPMNDRGELQLDTLDQLLTGAKIVSVVHLSNSLGTVNPVEKIIAAAHAHGALAMIDGAQWVAHAPTDVRKLDADFYAFSGHKLYGPTGIGVLYGKAKILEAMDPYQGGGDMIQSVTFAKTTYNVLPYKFEAGTPHIQGAIGLGAAIDWVTEIGLGKIAAHEAALLVRLTNLLSVIPGVRLIGTAAKKGGVVSFLIEQPPISTLDVGTRLDARGIAVRTGHHCCQPVMDRLDIGSTTRASLAVYNTIADVDALADAVSEIIAEESARSSHKQRSDVAAANFPTAVAATPDAAADELADTFDLLGDWEQRHQYLVELGDKLPAMPAVMKTEGTRVHGCMSLVHLVARKRPGTAETLEFLADSDAAIVRGLIAVLQRVYSGQSASQILAFDIESLLKRLGLSEQLTIGRRNGLASMIQRIRREATAMSAPAADAAVR